MKKIGFIDFFLDEWHANNYPKWIKENSELNGRDCDIAYAWAEKDKPGGLSTSEWCDKFRVKELSSIQELVEKSDYIIVLSPNNPEQHEKLTRIPLMSGKPVYVDKTFSPDLLTGVKMFNLAAKYGTPMFSSSALRFSKELSLYPNNTVNYKTLEYVFTSGPGSYGVYSIHQLEMIVSLMGHGANRIKSLSSDNSRHLVIEYFDQRRASLIQMENQPFQVSLQLKNGESVFISQCTDMLIRLIDSILSFFETSKPPVHREETLEIMAILEAGFKALAKDDTWIKIEHM